RSNLGVNFDPANLLLYDAGDPIEALNILGKYVIGVHCKDGKRPTKRGKLGKEYPLGEGDVNIRHFIDKLKEIGYRGPLTIEREIAGERQIKDILKAKKLLEKLR
ncbi:sugar phosphate isomerase/epimerase, partial [Candidatus Aerophobetes bacterium]|nr:sugar phosphate isomerase/epimerase [Candidatus Aerophobetes bacterium]